IRASKIDGPRVPLTVGPARRGCAAVSEEGVTLARAKKSEKPDGAAWQRPVAGILLSAVAVVAFLGLSSYGPRAQANWAGPVGHQVAGALLELIGAGAYAAALFLLVVAATLIAGKPRFTFSRAASWLLLSLAVVALLDLGVHARVQVHSAGGMLGATIVGPGPEKQGRGRVGRAAAIHRCARHRADHRGAEAAAARAGAQGREEGGYRERCRWVHPARRAKELHAATHRHPDRRSLRGGA